MASKVEKLPPMERRWQWRRGESGREVWSGQARRVAASPTARADEVFALGHQVAALEERMIELESADKGGRGRTWALLPS